MTTRMKTGDKVGPDLRGDDDENYHDDEDESSWMMMMTMMMNKGLRAVMWADNTNLPLPWPVVANQPESHDDDIDDDHL